MCRIPELVSLVTKLVSLTHRISVTLACVSQITTNQAVFLRSMERWASDTIFDISRSLLPLPSGLFHFREEEFGKGITPFTNCTNADY